ncbi:hypothetical protein [Helicobacter pylori]|uniref:hypothetical protein n=1 Tax=Helicobacter pylori TaxID=210 RepID=UPI0015E69C93|nr:hypothetical protein [Helicobacter pylori]
MLAIETLFLIFKKLPLAFCKPFMIDFKNACVHFLGFIINPSLKTKTFLNDTNDTNLSSINQILSVVSLTPSKIT